MILISHRGNINGIDFVQENTKPYIQQAIDLGYDVEVDIRYEDNNFLFGHDYGQYDVELQWLLDRKDKLWVHCKDFESLSKLIDTEVRVFYHQKEPLLSERELKSWKRTDVYGICSDYVGVW